MHALPSCGKRKYVKKRNSPTSFSSRISKMTTRKTLNKEEQLFLKLESIIDLYKNFQDGAEEEDKLTILDALKDIRQILTKHNITRPLRRTEITEIETVVNDLNSHVKAMALDDLFDEVNEIKWRMDVIEKRWELKNPKVYFYDEGENELNIVFFFRV